MGDILPLPLMCGIPPKMVVMPSAPWWQNISEPRFVEPTIAPECRASFGVIDEYFAEDNHLTQWLRPYSHLDAITAFRRISREGGVLDDPALPKAVHGSLPQEPYAYSDGSFTSPTLSAFGLASAAVWYTQRSHHVTDLGYLHSMH